MKKILCLIFVLVFMSSFAFSESPDAWYELTDNVLTIRVPVNMAEGENCTYEIANPFLMEAVADEYVEGQDLYAASFTNFVPAEGYSNVCVCKYNMYGTMMEVRRVSLAIDSEGLISVVNAERISTDDDFSVFFNPVGYPIFRVDSVYCPDSSGMVAIEGVFGDIFMSDATEYLELLGFGDRIMTMMLAPDCSIRLPSDLNDLDNLVDVEDIQAWYEDCCELLGFPYTFYATVQQDEFGAVTDIAYFYIP